MNSSQYNDVYRIPRNRYIPADGSTPQPPSTGFAIIYRTGRFLRLHREWFILLCSYRYVNEADCIRISIYWRLESNFVAFNNITCPLDVLGINLVTISDARLGIDPERSVILDLRSCTSQWLLYISMRQNTRVQFVLCVRGICLP